MTEEWEIYKKYKLSNLDLSENQLEFLSYVYEIGFLNARGVLYRSLSGGSVVRFIKTLGYNKWFRYRLNKKSLLFLEGLADMSGLESDLFSRVRVKCFYDANSNAVGKTWRVKQ